MRTASKKLIQAALQRQRTALTIRWSLRARNGPAAPGQETGANVKLGGCNEQHEKNIPDFEPVVARHDVWQQRFNGANQTRRIHLYLMMVRTLFEPKRSATNTKLDGDSATYNALVEKKSYTGPATVFGHDYQANYAPLIGADGKMTGAVFVGSRNSRLDSAAKPIRDNDFRDEAGAYTYLGCA